MGAEDADVEGSAHPVVHGHPTAGPTGLDVPGDVSLAVWIGAGPRPAELVVIGSSAPATAPESGRAARRRSEPAKTRDRRMERPRWC